MQIHIQGYSALVRIRLSDSICKSDSCILRLPAEVDLKAHEGNDDPVVTGRLIVPQSVHIRTRIFKSTQDYQRCVVYSFTSYIGTIDAALEAFH